MKTLCPYCEQEITLPLFSGIFTRKLKCPTCGKRALPEELDIPWLGTSVGNIAMLGLLISLAGLVTSFIPSRSLGGPWWTFVIWVVILLGLISVGSIVRNVVRADVIRQYIGDGKAGPNINGDKQHSDWKWRQHPKLMWTCIALHVASLACYAGVYFDWVQIQR